MRFKKLISGTFDAVDLSDLRVHLKIPSNVTAEDDLIRSYLRAAGNYFETCTNIVISESTWEGYLDGWPSLDLITINKNPLASITKIEYYNADNVLTLLPTADYIVDTTDYPCRIQLEEKPSLYNRIGAVKITFVSGFASMAAVDERIKQAVRILVTECEQDRASYVVGHTVNSLPRGFQNYANQMAIHEI